jgi:hypothetical protein
MSKGNEEWRILKFVVDCFEEDEGNESSSCRMF